MTAPRNARLLLTLALAALAFAPLAHAGSLANPEIVDDNDEVAISGPAGGVCSGGPAGGCPGFDFLWADADINTAWVNDTEDALLLTAEMKAGSAFGQGATPLGAPDACTYTFAFAVDGAAQTATATVGSDGAAQPGGVATAATVHDSNQMTFTVAKAQVGATVGSNITELVFTAHCEAEPGIILDDRAPDANAGRPYTVANGTAPLPAFGLAAGKASFRFAKPTSGLQSATFDATSGKATLSLLLNGTGSLRLFVKDASGVVLANDTATTSKTLSGKPGAWTVGIVAERFTGAVDVALANVAACSSPTTTASATAATATGVCPATTSRSTSGGAGTTSSTSEESPGLGLALVVAGVLGAIMVARRRLA